MSYIVSGIHTGIGKTICSSILCEALDYDYWKPVQAGELDNTDSHIVRKLTSNSVVFDERFKLSTPASPHFAAAKEKLEIRLNDFTIPNSIKGIIVETAGGLLSPLSDTVSNIDLMKHLALPNILVVDTYLGSINHSMLSLLALETYSITTVGIIFCGEEVISTRNYITANTSIPILCNIPKFTDVSGDIIYEYAFKIKMGLKEKLYAK